MNETMTYADAFTRAFAREPEFLTFLQTMQDRSRRERQPAPCWLVSPLLGSLHPDKTLQTETAEEKLLLSGLENGTYQLIALSHEPAGDQYFTKVCGKETLLFALPKGHRFARRKSLTFEEMNGENMILMSGIGFWNFIRTEKMPDSRFSVMRFSRASGVQSPILKSPSVARMIRLLPFGMKCCPARR